MLEEATVNTVIAQGGDELQKRLDDNLSKSVIVKHDDPQPPSTR